MFRRAFNVLFPRPTVASRKTFQKAITTLIGAQSQSVAQSSQRFEHRHTQIAYDSLHRILDSEKGDVIPPVQWSVVKVSSIDRTITYKWKYYDEWIYVRAYVPKEVRDEEVTEDEVRGDEEVTDDEVKGVVQLVVLNFKENGFQLGFGVRALHGALHGEIIIDYVLFASLELGFNNYLFNLSKDFDENSQAAWYKYLQVRRIEPGPYFQRYGI